MIKIGFIFSSICIFSSVLNAQKIIKNQVTYQVYHKYDTTINKFQKYVMELSFNDNLSVYYANSNANRYFRKDTGKSAVIEIGVDSSASKDKYYTDFKAGHLYRERVYTNHNFDNVTYLMPDTILPIKWNIVNEFRTIDTFKCQKAYCEYRGRNYIAWFCKDIPFSYGPWKLYGLPGLILEAFDTKFEVAFNFVKTSISKNPIQLPNKYKIIEELAFESVKLNELNAENFSNGFMNVNVELEDKNGKKIHSNVLPINNPIDLKTKLPLTF